MTAGDNSSDEVLDFYKQLSGLDTSVVDLKRLSSAKRARFISFCRSKGVDPHIFQGGENLDVRQNFAAKQTDEVIELELGGLGLDMVAVAELFPTEIEDLKADPSVKGIFALREIAYAETKVNTYETLAGIFAAKEAIVKTGCLDSYREQNFNKLIVDHDAMGTPVVEGFSLSISHCSGFAAAVAIPSKQVVRGEDIETDQDYQPITQAAGQSEQAEICSNSGERQGLTRPLVGVLLALALSCSVYALLVL